MGMTSMGSAGLALMLAVAASAPVRAEGGHVAEIRVYFESEIRGWLADPVIVEAVAAQNADHGALTQERIDALDLEWAMQATAVDQPFVRKILDRQISKFLADRKSDSDGLITEMIVMDAKGLNVGLSDVTSDYWQGDEPKWRRTYAVGPDAMFIDRPEKDESTQTLQAQVSATLTDPASGAPIGAITVGINLDKL